MKTADYWIRQLELIAHPEGGWFRETYRSPEMLPSDALPERYGADRCFSTAIYFLLEGRQISHLHRLRSDEIWHYHAGGTATIHQIDADGKHSAHRIGPDPETGASLQAFVPRDTWFGAVVDDPGSYILVGCTVAPGFEFPDFELADREELLGKFPQHRDLIIAMT